MKGSTMGKKVKQMEKYSCVKCGFKTNSARNSPCHREVKCYKCYSTKDGRIKPKGKNDN